MKNWRRMLYLKIAKMGRGSNAPVPSIISFGTKIKGNILGGDIVHIDGRLEGNVCCEELIIGIKGQVIGQVKAKSLNLYGSLQGTVEVENLFIAGSSHLIGDAVHRSIAVEPGAYIEGRCVRVGQNSGGEAKSEVKAPIKSEASSATIKKSAASGDNSNLFKSGQAAK